MQLKFSEELTKKSSKKGEWGMIRVLTLALTLGFSFGSMAAIPPMKITPLGKPDAVVKGTFYRNLMAEPLDFNPLSNSEVDARTVGDYVMQGMLRLNPDTYQFEPELALSYEASKDYLSYTFHLNPKAKFFDGAPVTAEDVKFSIDAVKDPKYKAASRMPYYEDVESVTAVDQHTVVIKMKKRYFKNLEVLGTTQILPKKYYVDPNKRAPIAPIYGSGPYKVEAYNRGKNIVLVRDPNFWGANEPNLKPLGKFERINFRFVKEENLELEMLKKGQIDLMWPVTAEAYEKKATGAPFGDKIAKVQSENKIPKSYGFVGWNQKNPIFKDRDTRLALSYLFNRKLLLAKFGFGKSVEGQGPVYFKSPYMPPEVKAIPFDLAKAKELLSKNGWMDKDKNGVLEKTIDGQTKEFRFDLLLPNRDAEKYFTVYKEDLKKAGIEMNIKLIEWNTFVKLLDEQKFDAVTLAWGGGAPEDDLKQIWHSESAKPGGSNFVSYKNKDVDRYIDQAREEMDPAKRAVLWKKAVKLIADDAVYTYMFNPKYTLLLVNKRIGYERPTYTFDYSMHYWYPAF